MPLFRKRPVVIEARRFHEDEVTTPEELARWCGGRVDNNFGHPSHYVALVIPTLEGEMTAQYGDYIIKGVSDEFYPCKPDIFEKTYEAAE